jgi:hypothetical protein
VGRLLGKSRPESSLSCVFTICYVKHGGLQLRVVILSIILRVEGYEPLPDCRNPVNTHVGTQYFRDQDRAIRLLIILNDGDPCATDGES